MRIKYLCLVVLACLWSACRATHQGADQELMTARPSPWYGTDGKESTCDEPPPSCPKFSEDKAFVDLCVASGFSAKTCGCEIKCSGKIDYKPKSLRADAPLNSVKQSCSASSLAQISRVLKARHSGTPLDRCIGRFLCNGNVGWCDPGDQKQVYELRLLAKNNCEAEVFTAACQEGWLDSLSCPDDVVERLSRIWAEFSGKETNLKRCIRSQVCSDSKAGCTSDMAGRVKSIKAAIDTDGCEYWLRAFCKIGGTIW